MKYIYNGKLALRNSDLRFNVYSYSVSPLTRCLRRIFKSKFVNNHIGYFQKEIRKP